MALIYCCLDCSGALNNTLAAAQPYVEQAKQVAADTAAAASDKARELGSIAQAQGGDTLR